MWKDLYIVNKESRYFNHPHSVHRVDPMDNPLLDILKRVEHMDQYRQEEQGVYHPLQKQIVKLRNTGAMDLFTQNDTGFRLDPSSQTIHEFGNHKKSHLYSISEWLAGSSKSYIQGDLEFNVQGKTVLVTKKGIRIKTGNADIDISDNMGIHINGDVNINIDGNMNANVCRHATIEVNQNVDVQTKQNMNLHAGQDIRITSDRDIHIDAARHLLKTQRCQDPSHWDSTKQHK